RERNAASLSVTAEQTLPPCVAGPGSVLRRFSALDLATATYAVSSTVLLLFRYSEPDIRPTAINLTGLLLAKGLLLVLVFLASEARAEASRRGGYSVLAEWYPLIVLLAIYSSIGLINAPRELVGNSYDAMVIDWEGRLRAAQLFERWGGHPGPNVVNWSLSVSYLAYFPMVIAAPMVLWLQGRHEHSRRTILGITITFLCCYFLFQLFPVAGPSYVIGWPETQSASDLPVRMVRAINERGDSWGSAFPSSHVAASAAALILGASSCRKLGTILFPVAFGILLAVVYFRVHYVLDAVAGLAVAAIAAVWVRRAWPLRHAPR
ncbi:MAG TPA: phosphatase PAP2 family protein, partial [Gemmatimonadales bacterium]|nr:phosphatase PAP2 family protein [Gemmatimonadales bacterium]